MLQLWNLLTSSGKLSIASAVALSVLTGVATTVLLGLVNRASHDPTAVISHTAIALFLCFCILRLLSGTIAGYLLVRLSQQSVYALRTSLCRMILTADLRQLEVIKTHRLQAALNEDVREIGSVLTNVPYFLTNLAVILSALAYLFYLSTPIAIVSVGAIAIGVASFQFPIMGAQKYFRQAREQQDRLFHCIRCVVDGNKELKQNSARMDAFIRDMLIPASNDVATASTQGTAIYTITSNWNRLLFFLYVGGLIIVVGRWNVGDPLSLGSYVVILLYIMGPIEAVMNATPAMGRAGAALRKLEQLGLSLKPPNHSYPSPAAFDACNISTVELRGVAHTYQREDDDRTFTLGPIDLKLNRPEILFLVGGNGSGKTTLAKLICGLYEPAVGQIYAAGAAITRGDLEHYRNLFSVIFSDFFLFDELIGVPAAQDAGLVAELLEVLRLQHKVTIASGRISTTDLSQGQRKRLALLVAFLEDRPFVLFDEWAADQDPMFKRVFYLELLPRFRRAGKCVVVISHDAQYYHLADRIIRLESGQLKPD